MNCDITFDNFSEKEIVDFIKLSRVEYGDLPTVTSFEHIKWKHVENPCGSSLAVNLRDNKTIVGRLMLQRKIFYVDKKEVPVAFITDALVHPDYRRPSGNFLSLMNSIKNIKDIALIFHTSNNKTEGIYSKILQFNNPFSLKGFGLPLSLKKIFSKKNNIKNSVFNILNLPYKIALQAMINFVGFFSSINLTDINPSDNIFKKFCNDTYKKNNFLTARNKEIVQWRFENSPFWKAQLLHIYKDKKYCGYVVWRQVALNDLNFFVIMDFLLDELSVMQNFYLRCLLVKKAIKLNCNIIFTLLNPRSLISKKFLGFPFVQVPDKILPHANPIFVHANDKFFSSLEKNDSLHITLSDLDYF